MPKQKASISTIELTRLHRFAKSSLVTRHSSFVTRHSLLVTFAPLADRTVDILVFVPDRPPPEMFAWGMWRVMVMRVQAEELVLAASRFGILARRLDGRFAFMGRLLSYRDDLHDGPIGDRVGDIERHGAVLDDAANRNAAGRFRRIALLTMP